MVYIINKPDAIWQKQRRHNAEYEARGDGKFCFYKMKQNNKNEIPTTGGLGNLLDYQRAQEPFWRWGAAGIL